MEVTDLLLTAEHLIRRFFVLTGGVRHFTTLVGSKIAVRPGRR